MASARSFTERLAAALLSLVATAMAIGGVALAGLGLTLRQTGVGLDGLPIITAGLMGLGAALALPGAVAVIWARASGESAGRVGVARGPAAAALMFAAAIPLALATQLGPLRSYWQDVARLAAEYRVWESFNGPTALIFVPAAGILLVPALEAIAAIVVALTCGLSLLLVASRSAAALKHAAIGALLVGGLVGASWMGVIATERLAPDVETLIQTTADPGGQEQPRARALVARHRTVGAQSAWMLTWAWGAVALLALGTRAAMGSPDETASASDRERLRSLQGLDGATRAQALLDAADHLHRTTPPRRF